MEWQWLPTATGAVPTIKATRLCYHRFTDGLQAAKMGAAERAWETPQTLTTARYSRENGNPHAKHMKSPYVYILASKPRGTLYVGSTSNLIQRVWQHKNDFVDGFTKRYGVHRLVWHEAHDSMESAKIREKAIKKWNRAWKIQLIERENLGWRELYDGLL